MHCLESSQLLLVVQAHLVLLSDKLELQKGRGLLLLRSLRNLNVSLRAKAFYVNITRPLIDWNL